MALKIPGIPGLSPPGRHPANRLLTDEEKRRQEEGKPVVIHYHAEENLLPAIWNDLLGMCGRMFISQVRRTLDQVGFAGRVWTLSWQGRSGRRLLLWRLILSEVYKMTSASFFLLSITGFMVGMLWAIIWYGTLSNIGGQDSLASFLVGIHTLHISPILTVVIVLLRYGAASTWEVSIMKTSGQFETLVTMGIPPEHFIGATRIQASLLAFPPLLALFNVASLIGAYLGSWSLSGLQLWDFVYSLSSSSTTNHVVIMLLKCIFIGLCIPFFCVYNGFRISTQGSLAASFTMRQAMGEAFFFSILTDVLVTVFYA